MSRIGPVRSGASFAADGVGVDDEACGIYYKNVPQTRGPGHDEILEGFQESKHHPDNPGKARRILNRYISIRIEPSETRNFFWEVDTLECCLRIPPMADAGRQHGACTICANSEVIRGMSANMSSAPP